MASPQNTKSAPKSPPVQDSPIYQYVSSLSPIKPVNARSGVQAYDNIDVPSPQLVFKTPNFSRQRNLDLLERSGHIAATGSETLSPAYAGNSMSFSGNMEVRGPSVSMPMSQFISCNLKGCGNADPSPDQPTVSPSSCVDVYLADPVEADDNLSSSPDFCVKRAVKAIQVYSTITDESKMKHFKEDSAEDQPQSPGIPVKELVDDSSNNSTSAVLHVLHLKQDADLPYTQNDSTDNNESTEALQSIIAKKDPSNIGAESLSAPQNEEHLGKVPTTGVSLTAPHQFEENLRNLHMSEEAFNIDGVSTGENLEQLPKNASVNTESPLLPVTSTQQHNVVNQYAADNLVVSVSKDCDMGSHVKENISASSFSQGPQDLNLLASKGIQSDTLHCTPQQHPDSPHNIQEGDIHVENLGLAVSVSPGKHISYNQEDGAQHQRGKRKRLQFESVENLRASTGCNSNSCSLTLEDSIVESPIPPLDTETINASHAESITVSNSTPVNESVPGNFLCRLSVDVHVYGEYQVTTKGTAPRPSGIGLHLNSIGSSGPTISNPNMQMPTRDASVQEEKCFVEHNGQVSQKLKNRLAPMSSLGPPVTLSSSSEHPLSYAGTENNGEKHQEDQANIIPNSSVNYHSPIIVKPINQSLPSKFTDLCMTPCTMKRFSSEEVSRSGDSTQSSPRKKRKKAPENEGHKRCNCKRSKCLKLYCDCFAAGSFCTEACACQGCFNKSELEDTVHETRQQIESRNPLAFAPKVVVRVVDLSKDSGDSKAITPTSARHKRGCNCKKSLCLKKYCECYQAGVGCSMGCRCEGCKNTFGRRDGCGGISEMVVEHKRPKETSWERNLSGELESIEVKRELANTKQSHSRLSPITPSLQTPLGNHAPKHQFPASYYPSPDSGASVIPSFESFGTAPDSIQSGALAKEREGSSCLVPYGPDSEYHNAGDLNSFSPGWDGFPEISNLSPLLKTPIAGGSSASKTKECKILQTTLFQGSGRVSTGCWRSSPITPLPRFGASKFVREPDSDNGLHGNPEDDTPEILKDTRQPIKTVKATSPNQKRVSPPHQIVSEARSSSPSALRSGRKFILQSVPAFPSLTPYSNNTRPDGA